MDPKNRPQVENDNAVNKLGHFPLLVHLSLPEWQVALRG